MATKTPSKSTKTPSKSTKTPSKTTETVTAKQAGLMVDRYAEITTLENDLKSEKNELKDSLLKFGLVNDTTRIEGTDKYAICVHKAPSVRVDWEAVAMALVEVAGYTPAKLEKLKEKNSSMSAGSSYVTVRSSKAD